jgi:extradiol dioxygenase family protein
MKPAGVHHVTICVADAQTGLAFYRDVLGMTQGHQAFLHDPFGNLVELNQPE